MQSIKDIKLCRSLNLVTENLANSIVGMFSAVTLTVRGDKWQANPIRSPPTLGHGCRLIWGSIQL